MTTVNILLYAILGLALAVASFTDVRSMRIPNVLTYGAALFFLVWHGVFAGLDGLLFSLAGLGLGFGMMLVPYMVGVMGGGDVKLMAAVGAALGAKGVVAAFLFTSLFGGAYALVVLVFHFDRLRAVFRGLYNALVVFIATRRFSYTPPAPDKRLPRLCYGLAIAAGSLAAIFWLESGGNWIMTAGQGA